jgi:hypothetical protein
MLGYVSPARFVCIALISLSMPSVEAIQLAGRQDSFLACLLTGACSAPVLSRLQDAPGDAFVAVRSSICVPSRADAELPRLQQGTRVDAVLTGGSPPGNATIPVA